AVSHSASVIGTPSRCVQRNASGRGCPQAGDGPPPVTVPFVAAKGFLLTVGGVLLEFLNCSLPAVWTNLPSCIAQFRAHLPMTWETVMLRASLYTALACLCACVLPGAGRAAILTFANLNL